MKFFIIQIFFNFRLNICRYLQFLYSAKNVHVVYIYIYKITPKMLNYMIALEQMQMGNLRSNLMIKKYNPNDKYYDLSWVIKSLLALHKYNLAHDNFHSGNLLNYFLLLFMYG